MKGISFVAGHYPSVYQNNFEAFLYNNPKQLVLQGGNKRKDFFIVHHAKKKVLGRVTFFVQDQTAFSPLRSPFGSFEFNAKLPLEILYKFIEYVLKELEKLKIKRIEIKNYADVYAPAQSAKLATALYHQGFKITPVINHHIAINEISFEEKLHVMERRKLRKCFSGNYQFAEETHDRLKHVYTFIESCRKEKEIPLNIELEHLNKTIQACPELYKIFSIKEGNTIIAATVIVVVNNYIIYNFLPASLSAYNSSSPMVFLLYYLYQYCQRKNYKLLDLGISAVGSRQQFNLMKFKERLGGESSLKLTFERVF